MLLTGITTPLKTHSEKSSSSDVQRPESPCSIKIQQNVAAVAMDQCNGSTSICKDRCVQIRLLSQNDHPIECTTTDGRRGSNLELFQSCHPTDHSFHLISPYFCNKMVLMFHSQKGYDDATSYKSLLNIAHCTV